jgi:hypothetical protein
MVTGCGDDLFNVQEIEGVDDLRPVDAISIPDQIPRGGLEGKGLDQLQTCPFGSGVSCDVEVNDTSPIQRQNQEYVERPKSNGWNREKIDGGDLGHVVADEGLPGLRWRSRSSHHVLGDSGFADVVSQLQQLTMDTRCAPEWVVDGYPAE